jgi:hypothetical protein
MDSTHKTLSQRETIKRAVLFVKIGHDGWKKRLSSIAPFFKASKNQKRKDFFTDFTIALKEDLRHYAIIKRWPSCWVTSCEDRLKEYAEFFLNDIPKMSKPHQNPPSTITNNPQEIDISKHISLTPLAWITFIGGVYITYSFLNDYINV